MQRTCIVLSHVIHASHVSNLLPCVSAPLFCHPNHGSQSVWRYVQAVLTPSMAGVEPDLRHALNASAASDPLDLEATAAQGPVLHKQVAVAAGRPMSNNAIQQASHPAVQVRQLRLQVQCSVQSDAHQHS